MSLESDSRTEQAIEKELGKNGWGLVRKIITGVACIITGQTIVGAIVISFWIGGLEADVKNHLKEGGHERMEQRMSVVQTEVALQKRNLDAHLTMDNKALERFESHLERIEEQQKTNADLLHQLMLDRGLVRRRVNP